MDSETKITYGIIGGLVVLLLGLVFVLQGGTLSKDSVQQEVATTTPRTKAAGQTQANSQASATTNTMENKSYTQAVITTNKGVIEVDLDTSKVLTVSNFGKLAESSFYNGVRFHRVIKGFMIQAGDPLSKDVVNKSTWGTGGPGYRFNDELTGNEQYTLGTLAMANAGPNTNGSQFFIVTAQPGVPLPPSYTVFGRVTKGIEIALAIENVATNSSDQPLEDIIIENIEMK